jgi:hypothetical protein
MQARLASPARKPGTQARIAGPARKPGTQAAVRDASPFRVAGVHLARWFEQAAAPSWPR